MEIKEIQERVEGINKLNDPLQRIGWKFPLYEDVLKDITNDTEPIFCDRCEKVEAKVKALLGGLGVDY